LQGSASLTGGIAAVSRIPTSMEVWSARPDSSVQDNYWYQSPTPTPVPAPSQGLRSSSNYILFSNCNPLRNLSITIEVTQEINGNIGFSFQLNAYSPQGSPDAWQQYVIELDPASISGTDVGTLVAVINNWPASG
jgi:hypothetical protein